MRKRVYIACPISLGDPLHNAQQADAAMFALMKAGFAPFNPILSVWAGSAERMALHLSHPVYAHYQATPNGTTHEDWVGMDLAWVAVSDAVLRLPGESKGADAEVEFARANGIPVFYDLAELLGFPRLLRCGGGS